MSAKDGQPDVPRQGSAILPGDTVDVMIEEPCFTVTQKVRRFLRGKRKGPQKFIGRALVMAVSEDAKEATVSLRYGAQLTITIDHLNLWRGVEHQGDQMAQDIEVFLALTQNH